MSKRFSIMVQEFGADHEVELCQVDNNPGSVIAGLGQKTLMVRTQSGGRRRTKTPRYTSVRIVDHHEIRK